MTSTSNGLSMASDRPNIGASTTDQTPAMSEPMLPSPPRLSKITKADNMVTVKIGSESTTYRVHKALLIHHSDYFRKALQECWKEGEERVVTLDDLEPLTFDVFVDWLYTSRIPEVDGQWLARGSEDSYAHGRRANMLRLKTYVLADRLGAQGLLNAINNDYVDKNIDFCPWYEEIVYAFDNIPSGRGILRLMVVSHCRYATKVDDEKWETEGKLCASLSHDFLFQVMRQYQQMRKTECFTEDLYTCDYHEHISEEEKKKCMTDMDYD